MLDKQEAIKVCVLSIIVFALLMNIADFFYADYYTKGDYSEQNYEIMQEFNKGISGNISYDKIDYTPFCMKTKPDQFFPVYYELSLVSGFLAAISVFVIAPFIIIKRKMFSRRYKLAAAVILFIMFVFWLKSALIEVSYDFIGCGKYW